MTDVTIPPDADYSIAQERFKAALESSGGVGSHVRRDADARPLKVEKVYITGDPREVIGAAQKPNDRLDIEVKIPGLRGLKEGQVQEKILQTLESQFATVVMTDGTKLSDAFDFTREKTAESKGIRPQIFTDTSPDDQLKGRDTLHILIALPPHVSHSQVVAALSGETPVAGTNAPSSVPDEPAASQQALITSALARVLVMPQPSSAQERLEQRESGATAAQAAAASGRMA